MKKRDESVHTAQKSFSYLFPIDDFMKAEKIAYGQLVFFKNKTDRLHKEKEKKARGDDKHHDCRYNIGIDNKQTAKAERDKQHCEYRGRYETPVENRFLQL